MILRTKLFYSVDSAINPTASSTRSSLAVAHSTDDCYKFRLLMELLRTSFCWANRLGKLANYSKRPLGRHKVCARWTGEERAGGRIQRLAQSGNKLVLIIKGTPDRPFAIHLKNALSKSISLLESVKEPRIFISNPMRENSQIKRLPPRIILQVLYC